MKKAFNLFTSIDRIVTEIPISDIMTRDPFTMEENATVEDALETMVKKKISSMLVVNKTGHPTGIISDGDILRKVIHPKKDFKNTKLQEIMSKNLKTLSPETSLGEASYQMKKLGVGRFPIMKGKELVGFVSRSDILKRLNEVYYQNSQLRWLPIVIVTQLIIIAILFVMYLNKNPIIP
jgi:tRNA nucleotidyltransferase (CCA-adding enzyme)